MVFVSPSFSADAIKAQNAVAPTAMSSQASRPGKSSECLLSVSCSRISGKTAPRLLHDASLFDANYAVDNFNILTDCPPPSAQASSSQPRLLSKQACRHDFATNHYHSNLPPQDYRPRQGDTWEARAVCRKCRIHLEVEADYRDAGPQLCPNATFPLHHLVLKEVTLGQEHLFQCSSASCYAQVRIRYVTPVISQADVDLLSDPATLKRRYEAAVSNNHSRSGFQLPSPVDALWRIRRYLRDSLKPEGAGKKIPSNNKRFLEAFADDCNELLKRLGFVLTVRVFIARILLLI